MGGRIINRFGVLLAEMEARDQRNVPLSEVSRKTGIAWSTLQAWANNRVTRFDASKLVALVEFFDLPSLSELIEYEPAPPAATAKGKGK